MNPKPELTYFGLLCVSYLFFCLNAQTQERVAEDELRLIMETQGRVEDDLKSFSAVMVYEDRWIKLRGNVECLQASKVLVGEYRNKPTRFIADSGWVPFEVGVFGRDGVMYYPGKRTCKVNVDSTDYLTNPFPENPGLIYSTNSILLSRIVVMPAESELLPTSPDGVRGLTMRFPLLVELGEKAGIHEIDLKYDQGYRLVEIAKRGGALGNFLTLITWKQADSGVWYPERQQIYAVGPGSDVDRDSAPMIECSLQAFETDLKAFDYLPKTITERLPFGTRIERTASKYSKTEKPRREVSYVGGKEGEQQYRLDKISDGVRQSIDKK